MREMLTADGKYLFADQDDTNAVVYEATTMRPVWDRWSYEAAQGGAPPAPPPQIETPPPAPPPNSPVSSAGLRLIQVTDANDGELLNRMYSYWSNAWIDGDAVYLFAGHADGRPRFFHVNLQTGGVVRLGPRLPYTGTGEGWYWDRNGWIYLLDGPRLRHVGPFSSLDQIVVDISDTHPGCDLWQAHSSDDGRAHSATVRQITREGSYPKLGTLVLHRGVQQYFPAYAYALDESALAGDYLVIKTDPYNDNLVITLGTGEQRWLDMRDGALGHSDCGPGYMVGADRINGTCAYIDLRQPLRAGRPLFNTWNLGHVSVKGGRCLRSDDTHLSLVGLNGEGVTPLIEHGMVGTDYDHQVMANLDPTGRVACYVSNHGGDRFDVFLLVLP